MSPSTQAGSGYGSQLSMSTDGVNFTQVVQLQRIEPGGSRQTMVDQTNLRTVGNFTTPLAVQVDGGEVDMTGVFSSDISQLLLGQYHGSLTPLFFRLKLAPIAGSPPTYYSFQAFVSEFKSWAVVYNKFIPFSAKLRLIGGMESALSGFQPNGFDPNGFQVVLI